MPDEKPLSEQYAPRIAESLKRTPDPDFWHACFAAAMDEGCTAEEAILIADEAAKDGPSKGDA